MKKVLFILLILTVILIVGCKEKLQDEDLIQEPEVQEEEEQVQEEIIEEETEIKQEPQQEQQITENIPCEGSDRIKIDDYCCVYADDYYPGMCIGEEQTYSKQKLSAQTSVRADGKIKIINNNLYFFSPKDWYVIKPYKMGNIDVPISYFAEDKELGYTMEIRIVSYENKNSLSFEEIATKIKSMFFRKETQVKKVKRDNLIPSYSSRYESKNTERKGLYEPYILEDEDSIIIIDVFKTNESYKSNLDFVKARNKLIDSIKIIKDSKITHKLQVKGEEAILVPLSIGRQITLNYNLDSSRNIYIHVFKKYNDANNFIDSINSKIKDTEIYTECENNGVKKIEKTCIVDEAWMVIANLGPTYSDVTLDLSWS